MQTPKTVALIDQAMELPREAVQKLTFNPMTAKKALLKGLEYLEAGRETLLDSLPGLALDELQELPGICDQLISAQGDVRRLRAPSALEITKVTELALGWRRRLLPLAKALVSNGVLAENALGLITARSSRSGTLCDAWRYLWIRRVKVPKRQKSKPNSLGGACGGDARERSPPTKPRPGRGERVRGP